MMLQILTCQVKLTIIYLGVYDAIQTHQNNNNKIYQNHHDVSYQIKQNREKSNKKKNGNNTSTTNNTSSILIKNQDVDENTNEKINVRVI